MKALVNLLALFGLVVTFGCRDRAPVPLGVYVSPTLQDFGSLQDQKSVESEFTIVNNSRDTVQILDIRPSCGCAKLEMSAKSIPPGGTATVRMVIDLQGRHGKLLIESILITDSSWAPVIRLGMQGTITATVLAGDIPFDLGDFPPNAQIDQTFVLSKLGDAKARIIEVRQSESEKGLLNIEALPSPDDTPAFQFRVTGHAPPTPGVFSNSVQLTADGTTWKQSRISVRGNVRSRWNYPEVAYLGFLHAGETAKKELEISNAFAATTSPEFIRNVAVSLDCPSVKAQSAVDHASGVRISLTFEHPGKVGPIACQLIVTIDTKDEGEQILKIAVHGFCF